MRTQKKQRKVIIIGFDGLDPTILEQLMGEGKLSNFSRLAATGMFSPLKTVVPPQSPVAWTTIATGQPPGVHGVFDFLTRESGEYMLKSRILKHGIFGYTRAFPTKTFWETASQHGIPATILKWPLTFPAAPLKGSLLTGLGTPDIRGTLGIYSFFTTRDLTVQQEKKGMIHRVSPTCDIIRTHVVGPLQLSFRDRKESTLPLEILLHEDHIRCNLDGKTFSVQVGSWSPWISLKFKVGLLRTVQGMCRFYLESIDPDFNLYMTPINIGNTVKSLPISYPPGYAGQVAQDIGAFSTLGLAEDVNALDDGLLSEDAFLSGCDVIILERENLLSYALERFTEGLLACVFDTSDRIQHMFWRCLDKCHPLHGESQTEKYGGVINDCYIRMDGIIGRVLDRFNDDALILVCSDHGFTSYRRSVHLNTWLVHQGYMTLQDGSAVGEPLFADVDWSRTVAFAFGLNSICLNVKNREKNGVLESERIPAIKEELAVKLKNWSDEGKPVIKEIYDPAELFGQQPDGRTPELIVGYEDGYRTSWQSALGEVPGILFIEDNLRKWSGDHCCDPGLVPGIFLANEKLFLETPHVKDICPAILDYIL